jgi:virulence factor Mce-like protein
MHRSRTLINGAIIAGFALLCIVGIEFLAVNIGQPVPFAQNYTLHAAFSDADGLPNAADVRVSGVDVGKVTDVSTDPSYPGETVVTMEITNPRADPVYSNGYASIRPKTLLGEKYVDLTVGDASTGEPIDNEGFLPPSQTGKDVSNDEIFNAFDTQTRQEQQQVLEALDAATSQRSGNIQDILPQLETVVQNLDPLAHVYEQDQPEVDAIFVQLNTIMQTLADEHQQLAGLLSNGNVALAAVNQKDQALLTLLGQAGSFATELNKAMAPTISAQQASIADLAPALSAQNTFLNLVVGPQPECGNRSCGIDQVFTGTLLGNINYPNDQLTVTNSAHNLSGINPELVTTEWDSMFSLPSGAPRAQNIVLSFHCNEVPSQVGGGNGIGQILQELLTALGSKVKC